MKRFSSPTSFPIELTEFDEIEIGAQFDRTLKMGLRVGGDIRRLQSWTSGAFRNNYWVGSINIGQQF